MKNESGSGRDARIVDVQMTVIQPHASPNSAPDAQNSPTPTTGSIDTSASAAPTAATMLTAGTPNDDSMNSRARRSGFAKRCASASAQTTIKKNVESSASERSTPT